MSEKKKLTKAEKKAIKAAAIAAKKAIKVAKKNKKAAPKKEVKTTVEVQKVKKDNSTSIRITF